MDRLDNIPWYTVPALLVGVPLVFWLITLVYPAFYDNVIWQYYWGPIKADTAGRTLFHNGVAASPGYNVVNTLSWAALMGVCLVGITQIFNGLKVKMSNTVIVGATLWVVSGAVWHVLEDAELLLPPLQYFFITPPIYLLFGAFGILALATGVYMERVTAIAGRERALQKLWLLQAAGVLLYTLMWATEWDQVVRYVHPVHVALIAALNYFLIRWWVIRKDRVHAPDILVLLNVTPLLLAFDYIALFLDQPWAASRAGLPTAVLTAPLLAGSLTGLVWATAQAARRSDRRHYRIIAGFAFLLAASLAWATQATPSVIGILGFLALAVGLSAVSAGLVHLMRHRADVLALIGGALLAVVAAAVLGIAIGVLLGRLGIDAGSWDIAIGALIVVGLALQKRKTLQDSYARLREQGGVRATSVAAFAVPVNLLLVFSQVMDGFGTALGLDLAGYTEKHVLSAFLIDAFQEASLAAGWAFGAAYPTFLAFVPVKLLVSLLVVWAIDIYSKEDVAKYPTFIGFVKFAIIMVGIGPSVRNIVRLSLGV